MSTYKTRFYELVSINDTTRLYICAIILKVDQDGTAYWQQED